MKRLILSALLAAAALAQIPAIQQYTATDTLTSSSGESFTILLPAGANRTVVPDPNGMFFGSVSAAATICLYTGTSAVTGTQVGATSLPGNNPSIPRQSVIYTGSSGSGNLLGCTTYPSAGPFVLTGVNLYKSTALTANGAAAGIQSLTVSVAPSTGTVSGYINAKFGEQ